MPRKYPWWLLFINCLAVAVYIVAAVVGERVLEITNGDLIIFQTNLVGIVMSLLMEKDAE